MPACRSAPQGRECFFVGGIVGVFVPRGARVTAGGGREGEQAVGRVVHDVMARVTDRVAAAVVAGFLVADDTAQHVITVAVVLHGGRGRGCRALGVADAGELPVVLVGVVGLVQKILLYVSGNA